MSASKAPIINDNQRFYKLFNFAPIGIAIVDLQGIILEANPRLCEMLGYVADELLAKPYQTYIHNEDLPNYLLEIQKITSGETTYFYLEKRYQRKDGQIYKGLLSVMLITDEQQRPLQLIFQLSEKVSPQHQPEQPVIASDVVVTFTKASVDKSAEAVKSQEHTTLKKALQQALVEDEFLLYYQPKIELKTKNITGIEALLRWQRPGWGMMSPAEFIPLAEETGLIVPIGEWVLRTACKQANTWRKAGYNNLKIAVNFSARQFKEPNLVNVIQTNIQAAQLDPNALEAEINEKLFLHDMKENIQILKKIKALGIGITIDDFGTGYSSVNYFQHLTINRLKIDREYIRNVPANSNNAAMVKAIIAMAHSLGIKVVAEGVETHAQMEFLNNCGCDEIQGYYFSRPILSDDITRLLQGTSHTNLG